MSSLRKQHGRSARRLQRELDARLSWKPVHTESEQLGDFDDAMFFGLEEVDGNAYISSKQALTQQQQQHEDQEEQHEEQEPAMEVEEQPEQQQEKEQEKPLSKKQKAKKEKDKAKREKAKKDKAKARVARERAAASKQQEEVVDEDAPWASLSLHSLLASSLTSLNFSTPTPIQASAIPKVLGSAAGGALVDVVGSAETGSGKTLAFGLPVLHTLMHNWATCGNTHRPYALILAPTRELAMQITSVLGDVCKSFRPLRRVEVVNVIGGLSEHKQRRQLGGVGKPCHIVVATPGRLCDMLDDESVVALQDMSCLRYLVVDEADRMMEDGHFPELHKIFSRITDHEALASKGLCPVEEARKSRNGTDYNEQHELDSAKKPRDTSDSGRLPREQQSRKQEEDDDSVEEFDLEAEPIQFEAFPSSMELEKARMAHDRDVPLHERIEEDDDEEDDDVNDEEVEGNAGDVDPAPIPASTFRPKQRQTLLFSATAINVYNQQAKRRKGGKDAKKKHQALMSLGLPDHMCQLLETVGIQDETVVAHVLFDREGEVVTEAQQEGGDKVDKKRKKIDSGDSESTVSATKKGDVPVLPKGLQQQEVRVATEDKDIMAYFYLLKHVGRTLIFVNSIKTARRVDGLLRALGLNCRCIHAQLQQKQRIKALESFVSSPVGILVATDVAARGLDLPKIQYVMHYDIARSPQVYIHRSGRTARAGQSGVALSIVAPEDTDHHKDVCTLLQVKALPLLRGMDLSTVPVIRERVKLAKKIFLQSFLASQNTKEKSWLENTAKEAGLAIDDTMLREISHELDNSTGARRVRDEGKVQKTLQIDRAKLRALLNEPYQEDMRINPRKKRAFIVVAK